MSVLSYQSIKKAKILRPFYARTLHEPSSLSYGCGAASYDVRLSEDTYLYEGLVTLASTLEQFTMPGDVCGVVHDKSSLARVGVLVQNTFIDPGWRGYLTLEISFHHLNPWKSRQDQSSSKHPFASDNEALDLIAGTPIAQIVFHYLDEYTEQPYSGQYQDQEKGAQPSKLRLKKMINPINRKRAIHGFNGPYRFLSNFWPCVVYMDGKPYPSLEHAYQAAKTLDEDERAWVRVSSVAGLAKRRGQRVTMREDWARIKKRVMFKLVKDKFTRDESLKTKLLETGNDLLVEDNTWGDTYWGKCDGKGKNHLGKILMRVRNQLRQIDRFGKVWLGRT